MFPSTILIFFKGYKIVERRGVELCECLFYDYFRDYLEKGIKRVALMGYPSLIILWQTK